MSWARRDGRRWVLWLAVAMPLAQAAAVLHELGHRGPDAGSAATGAAASVTTDAATGAAASLTATGATTGATAAATPGDAQAVHTQAPCELCLAAAALGAAAPPALPEFALRAAAPPAPAPSRVLAHWPAQPPCAYCSRAPPPLRIDR